MRSPTDRPILTVADRPGAVAGRVANALCHGRKLIRRVEPSAVDLKFLSDVRRARHRNFKSKNRTSIIYLLVHLYIPKFAPEDVAK